MSQMSQARSVSGYMKKRIPQFSSKKIYVPNKKTDYNSVDVVLIVDGELKVISVSMDEMSVETLCRKINEYYETGIWHPFNYYKVDYNTKWHPTANKRFEMPDNLDQNIYQFPEEENEDVKESKRIMLQNIETEAVHCYFIEVPKTDIFIPYQI